MLKRMKFLCMYVDNIQDIISPGIATQLWSDVCVASGVCVFQDIAKVWS